MSTQTAKIPSYCRHPSGQAFARVAGKQVWLGRYGTPESIARYEAAIAEWIAAANSAEASSIVELCAAYLDFARQYYRKDGEPTPELYVLKAAIRRLRQLYGNLDVYAFSPKRFRAVRETFVADGLARRTVNHYAAIVKRMFKWGVAEELVPETVYAALATVPGLRAGRSRARELPPVRAIDVETVKLTIQQLGPVAGHLVELQLLTGARPGELLAMRPRDIDRDCDPWRYTPRSHKTQHRGKSRSIFLSEPAQEIIAPYLLRPADGRCFGHFDDVPAYRRAIHRACDRLGIPRWSPNRLRHTAATWIRQTFDLETAAAVLGHASPDTTLIYAERNDAKAKHGIAGLASVARIS